MHFLVYLTIDHCIFISTIIIVNQNYQHYLFEAIEMTTFDQLEFVINFKIEKHFYFKIAIVD